MDKTQRLFHCCDNDYMSETHVGAELLLQPPEQLLSKGWMGGGGGGKGWQCLTSDEDMTV